MAPPSARTLRTFLGLALVALVPGCDSKPEAPRERVVVIGVDGLEWNVLAPLMREGRMPNLRALGERGAFGHLETMKPTFSPIIWTTIATGRPPEEHGIHGFVTPDRKPYTSTQRAVPALWNVVSDLGRSVAVFGWWITWPVEHVNGVMVSASAAEAQIDAGNWKPSLLPGAPRQVFPEALEPEVFATAERVGSLPEVQRVAREQVFGELPDAELGPIEKEMIGQTLWTIQSDLTYSALACDALQRRPTDLTLVYLGMPDVVGHRFWRYRAPERYRWPHDEELAASWAAEHPDEPPLAEQFASAAGERALADVIDRSYVWTDELIGRIVAAAGPDATVLVLSDHGMHLDSPDVLPYRWMSGHHMDAPPGVLFAAGPGIARQGDLAQALAGHAPPTLGGVLSITPDVLALLGLPSARDFAAQAHLPLLAGAARTAAELPPVDSYATGFRAPFVTAPPPEMEQNFVERMSGLGYIGDAEDGEHTPPPATERDDAR